MTQEIKSPFLVYQGFLSPSEADEIARKARVEPDVDTEGKPLSMQKHDTTLEIPLFEKFSTLIPELEAHYKGFKYKGTEHLIFQQFPVSSEMAEKPHCENAVYKRKKWIRVRDRDLTGVLWLKDYRESPPFDINTQVLGGKLEFPVYNFGFQPQKGTLVIYPANERFVCHTTNILVGELQCVRFHVCGEGLWIYQPADYPGDFRTWFAEVV
jgi:hypothetical protein